VLPFELGEEPSVSGDRFPERVDAILVSIASW
jgi:hypothetical protein